MANIKSQKKRIITNKKAQVLNNDVKQSMKTAIKKFEKALNESVETANEKLNIAIKTIDKAEAKGAKKAINALSGLGNLIYQLSEGIKGMATLVFPKYEARNGELVVVGTIDLSEALPKVGVGLESVIDSLVNACINAAEREDFKKRMKQAKKGFDGIGTTMNWRTFAIE